MTSATQEQRYRVSTSLQRIQNALASSTKEFLYIFFKLLIAFPLIYFVFAVSNGIAWRIAFGLVAFLSMNQFADHFKRRLNNSWTVDELGDQLEQIKQILERIQRNG